MTWRCLLLCLMVAGSAAHATDAPITPAHYVHQSWTIGEGAPSAVCAIAQGPDGYLWLGTGTGLYRFDGVQFTRFQGPPGQHLASSNLTALTFVRDGSLWIGSYDGGATQLKDGELHAFPVKDGFPPGWVLDFSEGADGEVWVATGQGLGRFDGQRWHDVGKDWDYPADRADWVMHDAQGTLWVAAVNQLVYLPRGAKRFLHTNVALAPGATLAVDRSGTLWVADRLHGTRPLRGLSAAHPLLAGTDALPVTEAQAALRLTFDSAGGLWATGLGTGVVFHVAHAERVADGERVTQDTLSDVFASPRELTSNSAIPVAEDREGNIWVGTSLGVDSYRRGRVGTLSDFGLDAGQHVSVARDAHGAAWVSAQGSVFRMAGDRFVPVLTDAPDILAILLASDDTLWMAGFRDLYRQGPKGLEKIPLPDHLYASRLKFVAPGPRGTLWASIEGLGVFAFSGTAWAPWLPRTQGFTTSPAAGAIGADGSMWFGYVGGELLHVDRNATEHAYDTGDGLDVGTINTISIGDRDTLFGGSTGLARYRDGRLSSLTDRDFPMLSGITGIVRSATGYVWVNGGHGIVGYAASELDRAFDDPHYRPSADRFNFRDGVQGIARQGLPVPSMQADAKGRLWFVTNETLQWIDPANQARNPYPPPVYLTAVDAGGTSYTPADHITLPPGGASLQIAYTALSLSSPARVHFRYRLDGEDDGWIDPGSRRQAYYTSLAPGSYRFTVIASNDDGVWNNQGASTVIEIPPRFYQTRWFLMLGALALLAVGGLVYALRIRRVSRAIRMQAEARHEERERIARELHDTLLQAVHALMLRFQAVAAALPEHHPLQKGIRSTLSIASHFIVDGRDRVKKLRTTLTSTQALSTAIIDLARHLETASTVTVDTEAEIVDHEIDCALADDVFAICREALINAFRHAQASRIAVQVVATRKRVQVRITDDGNGMPPDAFKANDDEAHWGLVGMRERAARIGATLAFASPGRGTVVSLDAPLSLHRARRPASARRTVKDNR